MPEPGEWFSPRTRPEMLTSDDPPVPTDKPALVRSLPGPATAVGRATAPLRRLVALVPAIGRRVVRVDDEPSRWQLIGMWATGSAIVAATGLAVAAVLGSAPPALTQPFERLAVLPGIVGEHAHPDPVSSADKATADGKAGDRQRVAGVSRSGGSTSYRGDTGRYTDGASGASGTVVYPVDLVPGRPVVPQAPSSGGTSSPAGGSTGGGAPTGGSSAPAPPADGSGSTTAPPPTTAPPGPTTTAVPTQAPTQEPTPDPTDPGTPTDPPPTEQPTDPTPSAEPTAEEPPADTRIPDPSVEQSPVAAPTPDPTAAA